MSNPIQIGFRVEIEGVDQAYIVTDIVKHRNGYDIHITDPNPSGNQTGELIIYISPSGMTMTGIQDNIRVTFLEPPVSSSQEHLNTVIKSNIDSPTLTSSTLTSPILTSSTLASSTLTGQRDIDIDILLNLDSKSLSNVCQTNRYVSDLCRNVIWEAKVKKDFPRAEKFKSLGRTWSDYYKAIERAYISYSDDIYHFDGYQMSGHAIRHHDLDILKYIINEDPDLLNTDISELMGSSGFLEGLKWLHEAHPGAMSMDEDNEETTILTLWNAAEHGHLDILQWGFSNIDPYIITSNRFAMEAANRALIGGYFDILKWFHSFTPPVEADGEGQEKLSDAGWEIFTWVVQNYTYGNDHIDGSDLEKALEENRIDILDLIYQRTPEFFSGKDYPYDHIEINDASRKWVQEHW